MLYAKITKRIEDPQSNVKAYAAVTVEDCAIMHGIRVLEGKNGLFLAFPGKQAFDGETNAPKVDENGNKVYEEIMHPVTAEAREDLMKVVLEAYDNKEGYAYINPTKEKPTNQKIEATMYERKGEHVKAAGTVTVGGFVCKDVVVALRETKEGKEFASVNFPSYERETENSKEYIPYMEFLKNGKSWDAEKKETVERDFKSLAEGIIIKQAKEVNSEFKTKMDTLSASRKAARGKSR